MCLSVIQEQFINAKKAVIFGIKDWIGLKVKGLEDPLRSFESEEDLNTCLRSFFVFKSGSVGFPIVSASALDKSN